MNFPSVALIEALQARSIEKFGGTHGLRESWPAGIGVCARAEQSNYDPDATFPEIAASIAWGIIKNHAFFDGNKRAGFAALRVTLEGNGFTLRCTEDEETAAVLKAAAGDFAEAEWTAWVVGNTAPLAG